MQDELKHLSSKIDDSPTVRTKKKKIDDSPEAKYKEEVVQFGTSGNTWQSVKPS